MSNYLKILEVDLELPGARTSHGGDSLQTKPELWGFNIWRPVILLLPSPLPTFLWLPEALLVVDPQLGGEVVRRVVKLTTTLDYSPFWR